MSRFAKLQSRNSATRDCCHNPPVTRLLGQGLLATALLIPLAGCNVGPRYKRPALNIAQGYRGALAPSTPAITEQSLGDEEWAAIFGDPVLQRLVTEALASNLDLQIAAQRVLEAQARAGLTRSQQFPTIGAGGSYSALQLPSSLAPAKSDGTPGNDFFNGGGPTASAVWNLDFWGLYRRQTEAARADLLATVWAQRATRAAIVEGVAQAYFELRRLDAQLEVTQNSIKARQDSLKLVSALQRGGAGSLADVRQAEELLHVAQANLPNIRRQILAQENTISILLGKNPNGIERGLPISRQPHPESVPAGLPAELIERRPDIQQAEAKLIAANARIGAAKAQFLPNISLSAMGGSASNQLQNVLSEQSNFWLASGSLTEPIFDGGRIRSNYHLSQAQEREMLLSYRKTILSALKDVSDALSSYQETRLSRVEQSGQVESAVDAVRLARARYSGGDASYLEVLTTDTILYGAQLNLAEAQEAEALSLVQLYASLGGGWK